VIEKIVTKSPLIVKVFPYGSINEAYQSGMYQITKPHSSVDRSSESTTQQRGTATQAQVDAPPQV
jgi:hypothetical protein